MPPLAWPEQGRSGFGLQGAVPKGSALQILWLTMHVYGGSTAPLPLPDAMHLTKMLPHVTWEGMIAATQPMCAAQEYPTQPVSLGSV